MSQVEALEQRRRSKKREHTPNTTKRDDGVAVSLQLQLYDIQQQVEDYDDDIKRVTKQLKSSNVLLTGADVIKDKYPTIDIVKLNGKEIDIVLRLCVPANARINIMSKPVTERKNTLLEKNMSDIKI